MAEENLEKALKQVAELEKENAELKTKKIPLLERKVASIRGCHRVDLAKLNARIEQVERLKKENTELKEQHKADLVQMQAILNQRSLQSTKLTKAVEHLKDLVYVVELGKNELATARILSEAKEFLKETE